MDAPRNITSCSNRTILGSFDPTASWPTEITQGPALEWQRVISDDFHAFRMTSRAMAVLYIVGVGAMGVVLVGKVVSMVVPRREFGIVEFGFLMVSSPPLFTLLGRAGVLGWAAPAILFEFPS